MTQIREFVPSLERGIALYLRIEMIAQGLPFLPFDLRELA
jgi:hypothetical protein